MRCCGGRCGSGWTTGTCASAAAKAATTWLMTGTPPTEVEIGLPDRRRVRFPVETDASRPHTCVVVKDAGDDPDCTDGARVTAEVAWAPMGAAGNDLRGGDGVGTITRPGLGLPVGAPAINPVPRRMIDAAVAEVTDRPLTITVSVPGGQQMAEKTSNARLGILGGISILGTTGVVRPFSTASYRASVVQQIDVAAAQGTTAVVLATGSRSDRAAQRLHPELDAVCFVEVGDFTGIALRHAAGRDRSPGEHEEDEVDREHLDHAEQQRGGDRHAVRGSHRIDELDILRRRVPAVERRGSFRYGCIDDGVVGAVKKPYPVVSQV